MIVNSNIETTHSQICFSKYILDIAYIGRSPLLEISFYEKVDIDKNTFVVHNFVFFIIIHW